MQLRCLRPLSLPVPLLLLAGCGAGSAGIIASTGDDTTNSATVLSGLEITDTDDPQSRAWKSPAKVRFTLTDQEGDRANVVLTFSTDGGMSFRPVTMAAGSQLSNLPPGDYEVTWPFADATDLGSAAYTPGVIVRAAVSGGNTRSVTRDMGNDPPVLLSVQTPDAAEDAEGIVQVGFLVADSSGDQVDLKVEFKFPEEGWQLARSVGVLSDEDTPEYALNNLDLQNGELADTFFWESDFEPAANSGVSAQVPGRESDVRLRLTARDQFGVEGSPLLSVPFRVDNNLPPQLLLDDAPFLLGLKDRGNIPISFTVFDEESDEVQIALQWKSSGGVFPSVRNSDGQEVELGSLSPEELRDLLESPARKQDRLDGQIAIEAPGIYEGRLGALAGGLAANQARLPELASSQAGLLAQGIVGRELEVVRPDRLEALEIGLAGACGAYVTEEGRSALVLYDSGGSTWRISEVDLADGTLLSTVGSGAGTPRALGVDPLGETLFVGTDQNVFRVERFSGVVSAPVAHEMTDGPRALAALGGDVVLGTGDDELRRLDFSAGATTPNSVLMSGLAQPWGVVRDPLRASAIYLAESTASTGSAVPGKVISVDLTQLVPEDLAAEVAPEDQGTLGSVPFPNVRALALERDGSRLLAVTSQAGRKELRSLALRSPLDLSDVIDQRADPFVREEGLVEDVSGAVATGRLRIRVVAPWTGGLMGVSGGAAQVRLIESYDPTNQVVTLDGSLSPPSGSSEVERWRIQTRARNARSSPTGRSMKFVWDTSPLPDPVSVELRALAADADQGAITGTDIPRPYRPSWDVKATLPLGSFFASRSAAATDLDGDGDMDLAAVVESSNALKLFFQTSPGTYEEVPGSGSPLAVGEDPFQVATGDLNGDGLTDLVSADYWFDDREFGTLTLHAQTSPGVFEELVGYGSPLETIGAPQGVALADLDGDGLIDLVSANTVIVDNVIQDGHLQVFFQTSQGTFSAAAELLPAGRGPYHVVAADLDGDGDLDLASVDTQDSQLILHMQTGRRIFQELPASGSPLNVGFRPRGLVAADLNGDGRLDLATANRGDGDVSLCIQTSPGVFEVAAETLLVGVAPDAIAAADLEGDGDMDLVANSFDGTLTVHFQTRAGTFGRVGSTVDPGGFVQSVTVADMDGDGQVDLVSTGSDLRLAIQASPGALSAPGSTRSVENAAIQLAAADLDSDGDVDIVIGSGIPDTGSGSYDGFLRPYLQTSPGVFTAAESLLPVGSFPSHVAVCDLDSDGDMDLVSSNFDSNDVTMYYQTSPGVFGQPVGYDLGLEVTTPTTLAAADLDGDGGMDLVVSSAGGGEIRLLYQLGPGDFGQPLEYDAHLPAERVLDAADLDGDGYCDLVARDASGLVFYYQTSPGKFGIPSGYDSGLSGAFLLATSADLNGDGRLDLAAFDFDKDELLLYYQTAPGVFGQDPKYDSALPVGASTRSVVASDLDGDGDIDLVSADFQSAELTLYFQTSPGNFTARPSTLPAGAFFARGVVAADLDGDGDIDLAALSSNEDSKEEVLDGDLTLYFNGK